MKDEAVGVLEIASAASFLLALGFWVAFRTGHETFADVSTKDMSWGSSMVAMWGYFWLNFLRGRARQV